MVVRKQNKMTRLGWIQNILILSAVVIFTLHYTIIGVLKDEWFSPLKNLVMIGIFLLFIYRFFTVSKEERRLWFTQKFLYVPSFIWLLAYFVVRCICFAVNGFQYGIAREIFFEFVFLVAICPWTVGKQVRFDLVAWVFCGINLVMNLANTYCYHLLKTFFAEGGTGIVNGGILGFLTHLQTYSSYSAATKIAPLYSNPNSAGIMTAMALLFSLFLIKNNKSLIVMICYWLYSLYALYLDASRGAVLGFVVALASVGIFKLSIKIQLKSIVTICLLICVSFTVGIYGFISYNLNDGNRTFTKTESRLDEISSTRYQIWQTCYRAHRETKFLGVGDATLEKKIRNERIRADLIDDYRTDREFVPTTLSVHNGYLACIFITGWIGFALFVIILLDKIKKAKSVTGSGWKACSLTSIVIFSFIISNFEALMVTSRYYTVLILLLVLAWENQMNDNEDERCQ